MNTVLYLLESLLEIRFRIAFCFVVWMTVNGCSVGLEDEVATNDTGADGVDQLWRPTDYQYETVAVSYLISGKECRAIAGLSLGREITVKGGEK